MKYGGGGGEALIIINNNKNYNFGGMVYLHVFLGCRE